MTKRQSDATGHPSGGGLFLWDQYARASGDDFTTVEKVEIARKIEEAMAGRHGGDRKSSCNTLQVEDTGNSRDIAAAAVGMSGVQHHEGKTKCRIPANEENPDEPTVKPVASCSIPTLATKLNETVRGELTSSELFIVPEVVQRTMQQECFSMASEYLSFVRLIDIIGEEDAKLLCRAHGGRTVYIARRPERCSLRGVISDAGVEVLCNEFGSEEVTLARGNMAPAPIKMEAVKLLELGLSIAEVARQCGCTRRYVEYVRTDMGLPPRGTTTARPARPPKPIKPPRVTKKAQVLALLRDNPDRLSPRAIADKFEVTVDYVYALRSEYGIRHMEGQQGSRTAQAQPS